MATVGYLIPFRFTQTRPLYPRFQYGDDEDTQAQTQPATRHITVFPSKNTAYIKDKTFVGESEEGKRSSQHCNNDISKQLEHSRERCNDPTAQALHCLTTPQDP